MFFAKKKYFDIDFAKIERLQLDMQFIFNIII